MRQTKMYQSRLDAGLCAVCGKVPPYTKRMCEGCLARARGRYKAWYEAKKARAGQARAMTGQAAHS